MTLRSRILIILIASTTVDVGLLGPAHAIPRYSARYRQNCSLCHHNPTGGGMRSLYSSQFLIPTEMVANAMDTDELRAIQPNISESVTIGTDIRTLHLAANQDRPPPEGNFFQMQGDLYVRFQADKKYSAYLDRGQSSTRELFGLGYVLPYNGYVKVGRFTPAFGWKLSDHRQFVRRFLFFEPPAQTDVGVELGIYPDDFSLTVATFNGARGSIFDNNDVLGFSARGSYRFSVGPLGFAVGGSYWRNTEPLGLRLAGGPFAYFNWKRLTWLGELDWSQLDGPATVAVRSLVTSHELSWQLHRGVDLRGTFNYYDPDTHLKTGIRMRMGAGFDALLNPFLGLAVMLNQYRNDRGLDVNEDDYLQSEVTLHIFY